MYVITEHLFWRCIDVLHKYNINKNRQHLNPVDCSTQYNQEQRKTIWFLKCSNMNFAQSVKKSITETDPALSLLILNCCPQETTRLSVSQRMRAADTEVKGRSPRGEC